MLIAGLFIVSWFLRQEAPVHGPDLIAFLPGLVSVGLVFVTSWLGGELVCRLRVGVDDDANLNAANSIGRDGIVPINERSPAR